MYKRQQSVQIGRIHKVQAGTVRYIVDADVVGFAQHALFGQHNIQNLTAGLGAGVILPGDVYKRQQPGYSGSEDQP